MEQEAMLRIFLILLPVISLVLFLSAVISFGYDADKLGSFLLGLFILLQVSVFYFLEKEGDNDKEDENKITLTEPAVHFGLTLPAGTEISLIYLEDKFPEANIDFPKPYFWRGMEVLDMEISHARTRNQDVAYLKVHHKFIKGGWFFFKGYQCLGDRPYTNFIRRYPDNFETFLSDSEAWIPNGCITPGAKIHLFWPAMQEKIAQKALRINFDEAYGIYADNPFEEKGNLFSHDQAYAFTISRLYLNSEHMADKMDVHLEILPLHETPSHCSPVEQGILHSFQTDDTAIWESGDCPPERVKIEFPANE